MERFYKFISILLLVGLASAIVWLSYRPYLGIDDAYIYFVYAKNFATGHGFVYNIGGERVEGFTSILWVLVCSLAYRISTTHFRLILFFLNILLVSYALYRLIDFMDTRLLRKNTRFPSFLSLFLLAVLFTVRGYLDWTVMSLMETGLWSACLIVLVISLLEHCYVRPSRKEPAAFAALLVLLVVTRPESFLFGSVFLATRFVLYFYWNRSIRASLRASLLPFALFIATIAGLTLFRLHYFGYPFPNTYYAKVSENMLGNFKDGCTYLAKFFFVYPIYWVPALMMLVSLLSSGVKLWSSRLTAFDTSRDFQRAQTTLSVIAAVAFLLPMAVGGDHFSLFRIYQPFTPLFLMLLFNVDFLRELFARWKFPIPSFVPTPVRLGMVALLPVVYLMNMPKYFREADKIPYKVSLQNDFSFPYYYRQVSGELNHLFDFSPRPSIGRIWAGAYAFAYDGPTVDLMGLNDTAMAHANPIKTGLKNHASFDIPTFYKLKPDFVDGYFVPDTALSAFQLPENKPDFDEKSFESSVLKGIFRDSTFVNEYKPVLISRTPSKQTFFTYARVDYIDSLRQKDYRITILQRKRD
jgi:hypothetical protein